MKQSIVIPLLSLLFVLCWNPSVQSQTRVVKHGTKYDTIIVKRQPKIAKVTKEIILPVPEYINQPYYYDKEGNRLLKLENANALMIVRKKTLGLKGAKQSLVMDDPSSKIRFTAKKDILFFIKTSGDVIDLTSYIKLYQFVPIEQKREVTITSKEGVFTDKDQAKGKLISFSVKMISKDNYQVQLPEQLEAGEYGFVWVKNMELKEFTVFAFGIDWKSSD